MLQESQMRNWRGTTVRERGTQDSCISMQTNRKACLLRPFGLGGGREGFSLTKLSNISPEIHSFWCLNDFDDVGCTRDTRWSLTNTWSGQWLADIDRHGDYASLAPSPSPDRLDYQLMQWFNGTSVFESNTSVQRLGSKPLHIAAATNPAWGPLSGPLPLTWASWEADEQCIISQNNVGVVTSHGLALV